jgi:hypothetical protein
MARKRNLPREKPNMPWFRRAVREGQAAAAGCPNRGGEG